MQRLTRIARAGAAIGALAIYEIGAHHAVATPGEHGFGLALVLTPVLAIALSAAVRSARRVWPLPLWALACAVLWIVREPLAQHFGWGLYLEHLSFNLAMALLFGTTLLPGREPLCTQFAALIDGSVTPRVARYTRQITVAWTMFFVAIAAISTLLFATSSIVAWSTFANYLALPLVGAMFVGEHAWRRIALPDIERPDMLAAVRAYRQSMAWRASRAP
ncbi:MAG TPA: hypothetical protein VL689_04945 [Paraburkholderia sp.]|nr:hypothetical protein [Paraburkholderia sp.]